MISIALRKSLQGPTGPLMLDLQAEIAPGSFVTLFGRSGAGKTTALRMLAGLADPDEGSITVDGVTWFDSARRVRLPPQKRSIGFMFQDQALFPNLSVRANIAYAAADAGWINELLDIAGLRDLQYRLPATLSGGQRQRVALARAIARKPALLLLDEPLSALDTEARTQLQDDLARMHRRFGLTVLLVSHDVGEVFKLSQRVLLLDEGRLVRSGSPSEVFLRHHLSGRLNLHGQVLAIRHEEVVYIISLLVGNDIIDVLASADEVADMHVGDLVAIAAKTVSPLIRKA